ncbi:MAG: FHA domain-containing protein [Gemmatimonadales bacterium]|nr:MAG: FHA domain-containing protein [Gemmatimonadales bacterium]
MRRRTSGGHGFAQRRALMTGWTWALLLLAVALLAGLGAWFRLRGRGGAEVRDRGSSPMLVFPVSGGSGGGGPARPSSDRRPAEQRGTGGPPPRKAAVGIPATRNPPPPAPARPPSASTPVPPEHDGTLQLLPGWLERLAGDGAPDEIRFVRVPGSPPEITLGRQPGPEFRHVQLRSPSVSRLHARLCLGESGWTIRNESATNPTLVNGTPIDSASGDVPLDEGDRIDMGDISFRFHGQRTDHSLPSRSGWHTDQGPRAVNQDAVLVRRLPDGRELGAVCDGMGSHEAGGRASHAALEALVGTLDGGGSLEEGVAAAQAAVLHVAAGETYREGVGTTLVAVLREGSSYRVVNVGDSRAYRFHADELTQISRDHSFVEESVASGRMTVEEALRSPLRHAVTRSIGESPASEAEYFGPFPTRRGEILLLSSDGLHGVLGATDIAHILQSGLPVPDLPRRLVKAALDAGTRDNVAVAVLSFHDAGG